MVGKLYEVQENMLPARQGSGNARQLRDRGKVRGSMSIFAAGGSRRVRDALSSRRRPESAGVRQVRAAMFAKRRRAVRYCADNRVPCCAANGVWNVRVVVKPCSR